MIVTLMKLVKLLLPLALCLGLVSTTTACVAEYDDLAPVAPVSSCTSTPVAAPPGAIMEGPCVYYVPVWVGGVLYRHYWIWGWGGWTYHGMFHGGWHAHTYYHGGGGWHGSYHHGGRR